MWLAVALACFHLAPSPRLPPATRAAPPRLTLNSPFPPPDLAESVVAFAQGLVRSPQTTYMLLAAGVVAVDLQHAWGAANRSLKQTQLRRWDPWEPERSACVDFTPWRG